MGRLNNKKMIFMYCIFLVASISAVAYSIWLHYSNNATLCQKVLQKPLMILGLPLLIVSILAFIGPFYGITIISWIFVISVNLVILGSLCLSIFGVLVTNRNASRALFGRDGNYSYYLLHKYVLNAENWEQIKSCLINFKFCQPTNVGKVVDFLKFIFYDIQSSCCKPPGHCDLEFHNATYWTMPKAGVAVADDDCKVWSNVQSELCFNCQSCTTSFLDQLHRSWKMCSIVYFVALLVFNIVCYVGYCVLMRKNRSKGNQRNPARLLFVWLGLLILYSLFTSIMESLYSCSLDLSSI